MKISFGAVAINGASIGWVRWRVPAYWVTPVVGPAQVVLCSGLIAAITPLTVSIGLHNIKTMSDVSQKG
ncbi:MAG: hypothetical protein ACPH26_11105, partial [Candidatus Puniceispirillaceae bacterium]